MNEKQREALAHYRESVQQVFKSTNPVHHLYAIFLMTITYTDARIAACGNINYVRSMKR